MHHLILAVLVVWPLTSIADNNEPWAGFAREAEKKIEQGQALGPFLDHELPGLSEQLEADRREAFWLPLWGQSINFDEGAHAIIVAPELLDLLIQRLGAPPRSQRMVHAGLEHTYGYLFSLVRTPFGYKRARWVDHEIEKGLGIPVPLLEERTQGVGLLGRVSYLLAALSLRDNPLAGATLLSPPKTIPSGLVQWGRQNHTAGAQRLTETVDLAQGRRVTIRTDFFPFGGTPRPQSNQALLVYSVKDSAQAGPRIVTAFPVAQNFIERTLDRTHLGAGKPIATRYNAFVSEVTDSGTRLTGFRKVEALGAN